MIAAPPSDRQQRTFTDGPSCSRWELLSSLRRICKLKQSIIARLQKNRFFYWQRRFGIQENIQLLAGASCYCIHASHSAKDTLLGEKEFRRRWKWLRTPLFLGRMKGIFSRGHFVDRDDEGAKRRLEVQMKVPSGGSRRKKELERQTKDPSGGSRRRENWQDRRGFPVEDPGEGGTRGTDEGFQWKIPTKKELTQDPRVRSRRRRN